MMNTNDLSRAEDRITELEAERMLTVGSLFAGIGGFDLGFERAGMRVAWHSEIEPFACAVLNKHWPEVQNHGDIRSIRADAVEPVGVLCGGFPCQDISVAGKGAGIDGARSGLWSEYARLVRSLKPGWVVAENVPALRTRGYDRVADDLEGAGYTVQAFVVGADDLGAPHRRKRVWIIAYSDAVRQQQQRVGGLFDGERAAQRRDVDRCARAGIFADAEGQRLSKRHGEQVRAGATPIKPERRDSPPPRWQEGPPVPALCELDDGLPPGLVRHRRRAIGAVGNSLVPQIAEAIGRAIMATHSIRSQT